MCFWTDWRVPLAGTLSRPISPPFHTLTLVGETWLIREQVIGSLFSRSLFVLYIHLYFVFRCVLFIPEGTGEWDERENNMQHRVIGQIQTGGHYRAHVVRVLVG